MYKPKEKFTMNIYIYNIFPVSFDHSKNILKINSNIVSLLKNPPAEPSLKTPALKHYFHIHSHISKYIKVFQNGLKVEIQSGVQTITRADFIPSHCPSIYGLLTSSFTGRAH